MIVDSNQKNHLGELRCCWLSYLEVNPKKLQNKEAYRDYLLNLLQPFNKLQITDLFVQVRPFADAIYPSELFESSESAVKSRGDAFPFDYLKEILKITKGLSLRVHAWINPYRVLSDASKIDTIDPKSAVGRLLQLDNGKHIIVNESGVWLQPASPEVQKLILDGLRELMQRYKICGIHIDDYFYPPHPADRDAIWYKEYIEEGGSLNREDWRREQISALLRGIYRTVHAFDDSLIVSVSPGGNPEFDRNTCFADVAVWCSESGYCDWIVPQLYYGFQNESMPFYTAAKRWQSLCNCKSVRLVAGLAMYKVGKADLYAGAKGRNEWVGDSAVLAKQVQRIRQLGFDGFALFSAQFVNFQEKVLAKACQKLEAVL